MIRSPAPARLTILLSAQSKPAVTHKVRMKRDGARNRMFVIPVDRHRHPSASLLQPVADRRKLRYSAVQSYWAPSRDDIPSEPAAAFPHQTELDIAKDFPDARSVRRSWLDTIVRPIPVGCGVGGRQDAAIHPREIHPGRRPGLGTVLASVHCHPRHAQRFSRKTALPSAVVNVAQIVSCGPRR
ncbi:MAG: hypothetical protein GPOALKHO_000206 [Sodalis sp.]|nr:MAG: hypothetical protein GPOALKHO_000206 [Sodalis sp.]